jgi:hypothetical protein
MNAATHPAPRGDAPPERHAGQESAPNLDAAALVPSLEAGWRWLEHHETDPRAAEFFDRWIARLHAYQRACRAGAERRLT